MPSASMGVGNALSYQAIESLWTSAGGSKSAAPLMAAIAIAESGGRPSVINNNSSTGDYSVGLWQINYFGNLYSSRSQAYGSPSALQASPTAQARAAVDIYNGQGLSAWSTYTSGAYKQYLQGANYNGSGTVSATPASATTATPASSQAPANCLWGFGWPGVAGVGGGYICLLTKGQARAISGALLMGVGGFVALGGTAILAAYGLKQTGALDQMAQAAAVLPGAGGAAARLASASGSLKAGPKPKPKPKPAAPKPEPKPKAAKPEPKGDDE